MAIVRFSSKAAGSFILMPETQKQIFKVIGRPLSESGAISAEDAAEWIEKLETAVALEKQQRQRAQEERRRRREKCEAGFHSPGLHAKELFEEEDRLQAEAQEQKSTVPFSARVYPLLQMLRKARKKGEMVMWGIP